MSSNSLLGILATCAAIGVGTLFWAKTRATVEPTRARFDPHLVPIREYRGPLAFFRRHYNGDYSLGRSYWVNTLLISLFAPILGLILIPWLGEHFPAQYGSGGVLFITTLGLVAWFWAVSGTWASANKHTQRGGRSGWATAAKIMIVLGVIRTIGDVGNMLPMLKEHFQVASGTQLGPSTKLEVRADGRSILLSGGINDGSAAQLQKALEMAPAVSTVVLSSDGGWIREGVLLAEVVRSRGLNTYVEGYCASACTIAFLAGKERAAAPTARIGFHGSRSVGNTGVNAVPEDTSRLREIYRTAGLPASFIRQALETPHTTMWHPAHDLLLSAGVFTRVSRGGETAAFSTSMRSREKLIEEFRKVEVFSVLAERSPADFARIVDAAWDKVRQGATDAQVTIAARAQVAEVLPKYLPLAKDETLVAYQALIQEQLEALRQRDPLACVAVAFPSGSAISSAGSLPPELAQRELRLMAQVLREADNKRSVKPKPQAVERIAQRAAAAMTRDQIAIFSEESVRQRAAPIAVCDSAIRFVGGLNTLPAAERARSLRLLYASN